MNFKEWFNLQELWVSKGKAQNSVGRPGPRDSKYAKPKPHDLKLCGMGGGPGPGGACAGGGSMGAPMR